MQSDRVIKRIIVHCSDSDLNESRTAVERWHTTRGFREIGYHYYIRREGDIWVGRPIWEQGAHCFGQNHDSIGICIAGRDNFPHRQRVEAVKLIKNLLWMFSLKPDDVYPHNHFNRFKDCPRFDWSQFVKYLE